MLKKKQFLVKKMIGCNFWALLYGLISFLVILPYASCAPSVNFNLSTISPDHTNTYINLSGDAYISNEGIQVTPNERGTDQRAKVGRAVYHEPLQLWDKVSGNLTDFSTHFTFSIYSNRTDWYGDGLAFFLAPTNSTLRPGTAGGGLGLTQENLTVNSSAEFFVAVEFDTFQNAWDPPSPLPNTHVGIDINSVISVANVSWWNNVSLGRLTDALISYESTSHNLSVTFTGYTTNQTQTTGHLSYVIDLRKYLPEQVLVGFSASTGSLFQTNNVKSWEMNWTLGIFNTLDPNHANTTPGPNNSYGVITNGNKIRTSIVVGSVVSSVVIVLVIVITFFIWRKRRNKGSNAAVPSFEMAMDEDFEKGCGPKKFSYDELMLGTNNFAEEDKLGEGGFGSVYKGFSEHLNSFIAVKRVSQGSKQGIKEYASEVKIIGQLRHRNLVQLIGWCHEKCELLLVYEFLSNGSLDAHLFKDNFLLPWEKRYKVAQGLASALLYLHEGWERLVLHRDIKSSNIMLDANFNAKLGDFGLARSIDHGKGLETTAMAGTMGYMAPEYVISGVASEESDVYSFGIVALEIASGRKALDHKAPQKHVNIAEWIWDLHGEGKLMEAADPKLKGDFEMKEMETLIIVGLWCAHPNSTCRPRIRQALSVLNFEAQSPNLLPVMPFQPHFNPSLPIYASSISRSHQLDYSSSSYQTNSSNFTTSSSVSSTSAPLLYN